MPDALTMTKVVGATLDLRFDWSALLGSDTIASVAWSVSGVTAGATSNTTTTATQRISGGSAGTTATVECTITTAASYVYVRTVAIDVVASIDACEIIKASGETISVPAPTWSDLNGDTIASYSWAAAASLTIVSGGSAATVVISGGTVGQDYALTCTITTTAGQIDVRVIRVKVRRR